MAHEIGAETTKLNAIMTGSATKALALSAGVMRMVISPTPNSTALTMRPTMAAMPSRVLNSWDIVAFLVVSPSIREVKRSSGRRAAARRPLQQVAIFRMTADIGRDERA